MAEQVGAKKIRRKKTSSNIVEACREAFEDYKRNINPKAKQCLFARKYGISEQALSKAIKAKDSEGMKKKFRLTEKQEHQLKDKIVEMSKEDSELSRGIVQDLAQSMGPKNCLLYTSPSPRDS